MSSFPIDYSQFGQLTEMVPVELLGGGTVSTEKDGPITGVNLHFSYNQGQDVEFVLTLEDAAKLKKLLGEISLSYPGLLS